MRTEIKQVLLGTAVLFMAGCAVSLCPEDRQLLTQAIDASRNAAHYCARQPEQAAATTAQPVQVQQTADRDAEKNLEDSVKRAEAAAERAEQAAEMTRKVFESGLRK